MLDTIDPAKDVDSFHPVNVGRLSTGTGGLIPCTPLGCMMLLESVIDDFHGLKAVVIGKSNIVGKPVAMLLLERECTVTVTHILTRDLPSIVRGDWVKHGAVMIDVGINCVTDANGVSLLIGDAAFDELGRRDHARA